MTLRYRSEIKCMYSILYYYIQCLRQWLWLWLNYLSLGAIALWAIQEWHRCDSGVAIAVCKWALTRRSLLLVYGLTRNIKCGRVDHVDEVGYSLLIRRPEVLVVEKLWRHLLGVYFEPDPEIMRIRVQLSRSESESKIEKFLWSLPLLKINTKPGKLCVHCKRCRFCFCFRSNIVAS